MMEDYDPKEFLLFALQHFEIEVISHEGKMIYLEKGYSVEVEGRDLFKLLHGHQVVAPFNSAEELCHFVKLDMQLNEED